jgi:hypothetical protein
MAPIGSTAEIFPNFRWGSKKVASSEQPVERASRRHAVDCHDEGFPHLVALGSQRFAGIFLIERP